MEKKDPLISVVMPVYNCEKYVWEAIQSILDQTLRAFEFIIIDDWSTDTSWEIIKSYAVKDSRIKAYTRKNKGIVATRNELASYCNTQYMAILDSDDIALPDRLEHQYTYMEQHKDVAVVWWHTLIIDKDGNKTWERKYIVSKKALKRSIFKKDPFAQPTVCIRLQAFYSVWWYQVGYERVEDYKLWCELYTNWYTLANMDRYLIHYRVFDWQWKARYIKHTLYNTMRIQSQYIFKRQRTSISNLLYFCAEGILYLFPKQFILWLFKVVTYKASHE